MSKIIGYDFGFSAVNHTDNDQEENISFLSEGLLDHAAGCNLYQVLTPFQCTDCALWNNFQHPAFFREGFVFSHRTYSIQLQKQTEEQNGIRVLQANKFHWYQFMRFAIESPLPKMSLTIRQSPSCLVQELPMQSSVWLFWTPHLSMSSYF